MCTLYSLYVTGSKCSGSNRIRINKTRKSRGGGICCYGLQNMGRKWKALALACVTGWPRILLQGNEKHELWLVPPKVAKSANVFTTCLQTPVFPKHMLSVRTTTMCTVVILISCCTVLSLWLLSVSLTWVMSLIPGGRRLARSGWSCCGRGWAWRGWWGRWRPWPPPPAPRCGRGPGRAALPAPQHRQTDMKALRVVN